MRNQPILLVLLVSVVAAGSACSASESATAPSSGQAQPGYGRGGNRSGPGVDSFVPGGGTDTFLVDAGVDLTSPVFGPSLEDLVGAGGTGGSAVVTCEYGDTPSCDFTRVDNCCFHLACKYATNNPDNIFPTRACEALLSCVRTNGCSTASDPVCFLGADGRDDPNAVCADEAYSAGHTDADSPYEHTVELINCLCGYNAS